MLKLTFILFLVAAVTLARDEVLDGALEPSPTGERFLAMATTSTVYVPTKVLAFTTVQQTCYSTVNVTGPCRRRRGIEEEPMILAFEDEVDVNPSGVLSIEETTAPHIPPGAPHDQQVRVAKVLESSSRSVEEVEIFGLEHACNVQARKLKVPLFGLNGPGLTLLKVTTSTFTDITYSTITSGYKTFTIAGCTPATFAYPAC